MARRAHSGYRQSDQAWEADQATAQESEQSLWKPVAIYRLIELIVRVGEGHVWLMTCPR